ncbi:hypothetical protein [Cyclonatronum proteinivorum]|uniref:hypothetical protein n=1 Tax=Cyclonatronum proteinivorum TaxID=1457365 RepID=UPI0013DF40F8|nr:hypothetical protein [Cyclonatronum proteinivorum]
MPGSPPRSAVCGPPTAVEQIRHDVSVGDTRTGRRGHRLPAYTLLSVETNKLMP